MKFRPCIDIHNGKVKQIVGSSLKDVGNEAVENFVSDKDAAFFAGLYAQKGLSGGHIIILNNAESEFYNATKNEAINALKAAPYTMQIGGGINADNALEFLNAGATHVIVTSYVFSNGEVNLDRLKKLKNVTGKEHLVLDLSCRKKGDEYYIVTDRWQKMTGEKIDEETLDFLADYCDEFLVHAADVEGKQQGIEQSVSKILGDWGKLPITYAGGVHSLEDIKLLKDIGHDRLDVTIGSALDLFGGYLKLEDVLKTIG
ncbi:MAG: phosphoribosylformimino-5-aminoimidazole carboxamide ribotide isomerase [Butyrivibrio sp.]|nr:phosphoribosylformimino-5-aminoimidazole carboxamide ribotide isomerase [Butyrivibrio sp.]